MHVNQLQGDLHEIGVTVDKQEYELAWLYVMQQEAVLLSAYIVFNIPLLTCLWLKPFHLLQGHSNDFMSGLFDQGFI